MIYCHVATLDEVVEFFALSARKEDHAIRTVVRRARARYPRENIRGRAIAPLRLKLERRCARSVA